MLYNLEQGTSEHLILKRCQKEKLPIPDKIANAPSLNLGMQFYYNAFFDLYTCRGGMGDSPISWIDIQSYCKLNELDDYQTESTHYYINEMDKVYLNWVNKKNG